MLTDKIYIVEAPDQKPRAFGSITAIFDNLTPEEIGLPIHKVWGAFKEYDTIATDKVTITKATIIRRRQRYEK